MNSLFQTLAEQFRTTSLTTKGIAAMVALALVAIIGTAATVARQPHFEIFTSGIDDVDAAKITKALANAGVKFELSQPPGPYVIYVDESDRHKAYAVVAASGALEHAPRGILGNDGGMSTVFMSSSERAQVVQKREWQEVETLLVNGLEFVAHAKVQTSARSTRLLGREEPRSGSVTVTLRDGGALTRSQAATIANLVRFAMRIEPANLFIADQSGRSGYRGSDVASDSAATADPMLHKLEYDRRLAEETTQLLASILGPDLARVTVSSDWDHDLSTRVTETTNPDAKVVISEDTQETDTPRWDPDDEAAAGVGAASNLGNEFGIDNMEVAEDNGGPSISGGEHVSATTSESHKEYFTPRATEQVVRTTPVLRRLSVSLFLDESLADLEESLTASVKAAVGFRSDRLDVFSLTTLPFAGREPVDGETPVVEPVAAPLSPVVETILRRGVEILSAIVFLFVLFRSLKGARSLVRPSLEAQPKTAGASTQTGIEDVPIEVLARAQVEEILNSNPEKIGEILSSWAREEAPAA